MKPMKTALGIIAFITLVQLAALGAMAFVHEDEDLAHGLAGLRLQFLDEGVEVVHVLPAELVDQRAQQARRGLAELRHQVAAAAGALDRFARTRVKTRSICLSSSSRSVMIATRALGLFSRIHFASSTITMLLPLPCVCQMMPPLRSANMLLRGLDPEILVHARQLLYPAVEQHEVVHQLDQPILGAHLQQILVQLEAAVVLLVLLPPQEILLRRADRAVLQALGIVAGEDELHGAEEPRVELGLLVGKALADAVADGDAAVLQLQYADGDAVHVQHQVRPALVVAAQRDFLGDGEVVLLAAHPS